MKPVVRVVGLGPGSLDHLTRRTHELLSSSPVVRLRTRDHPSARHFAHVASYDAWYEEATSFEELYARIVEDLVSLARSSPMNEVLYAVPGSPVVAERTVELLSERKDVTTIREPAVSVIDVACAVLGRDPVSVQLRVVDALGSSEDFRGPGALLIVQTYSPEVLVSVADRLPASTLVTVLHHLGLEDEVVATLRAAELSTFASADHLTSLWVQELRDAGVAVNDLVDFMKRLRRECPWDQEQTHASLTRHLLEEAYEALDALEVFVRRQGSADLDEAAIHHVQEELGDLLFQIVFHGELGDEEGYFNFATIADAVRHKLTGRHPHVFGGVEVNDADDVAARWEVLKREEKGRHSVTDGIAWQLPALSLYAKLWRHATLLDVGASAGETSRQHAIDALRALRIDERAGDTRSGSSLEPGWGDVLVALVVAANAAGVDLEGVLRERATRLRDAIRAAEDSE